MQLFGLTITRTKSTAPLQRVDADRGWWPLVRDWMTGAWQTNVTVTTETVLTYSAVYACISLIASDIAKMGLQLLARGPGDIWTPTENAAYSPVLRKPNHYQTRIKFIESWLIAKLIQGNAYILKVRDNRNVVVSLYPLDPFRVRPLVAPDGSVFYELKKDLLSGLETDVPAIPAREIIHDPMDATFYHPLVGISPLSACGLAATQGLQIQDTSTKFFAGGSTPGGVLTAPGTIAQETADRMKAYWDANFTGANVGKVAVLGDGLKYEAMSVKATDAQLIEQLRWTAENVCMAFHVPAYMIGVGAAPTYNNIEALTQAYYSQCLQIHIESIEALLDQGLELAKGYATAFDLDDLLRMDSATNMDVVVKSVGGGIHTPNEARAKFNLPPKPGGDTPYMQEQQWPLQLLAARDVPVRPPTPPNEPPAPAEAPTEPAEERGLDLDRLEALVLTRAVQYAQENARVADAA